VQPGQTLSRKYLLQKRIAEGGMGEVWLARNQRTQGECAIKVLLPALARNAEALQRFVKEARATGQLKHPGIIQVFDAGKTGDGRPYLVMELLAGESLAERLARDGGMPAGETCVLLSQVARAAHHAHRMGVVHRDLSTSNVFLVRPGDGGAPVPKIVDFGVSKIANSGRDTCTLTGSLLGSPAYMSPEQAEGAECVDARTDVWSLGVLLYQCLSGRVPFDGRNHNATMLAVISRRHTPLVEWGPELDPELCALVEGCLIKDREERVQTAGEVADTLERVGRRLLRSASEMHFAPRRRLSDRLPPEPKQTAFAVAPRRRRGPGTTWLALGTGVLGALLGVLLGVTLAGAAQGSKAPRAEGASEPTAPQRQAATTRPRGTPGSRAENEPRVHRLEELPREADVDLARAVAEGLGVERR
jgi:serine/threonine-protein kinase